MKLNAESAMELCVEIDELVEILRSEYDVEIPRPASQLEISTVCESLGVRSMFELELWLLRSAGPILISTPIVGFASADSLNTAFHYQSVLDVYPEWEERCWLPVASDGCGNYFVFPLDGGGDFRPVVEIQVTMSRASPRRVVASDLLTFLKRLILAEIEIDDDPFSEESLQQHDPDALLIRLEPVCQ